ncbi:hypothetical protein RJ639_047517, partial [Escallonia herrerae]
MSLETLNALHLSEESAEQPQPFSARLLAPQLHQALDSCSQSIKSGDIRQSEALAFEVADFLSSISDSVASELDGDEAERTAYEIVSKIHQYITSLPLDQDVMDVLAFHLPKAAARFACASGRCSEVAESRQSERRWKKKAALGSPSQKLSKTGYFAPLLSGLAKVFRSIQRQHFKNIKAAVMIILNALKATSLEPAIEDTSSKDLFDEVILVARSIQAVSVKLEGDDNRKLRALFGLFVLQIMALASISRRDKVASCTPLVLQLSQFLQFCGLSNLGLITGCEVEMLTSIAIGDDGDDYTSCFCYVKHGAALAVIWGHESIGVTVGAELDLSTVKDELRRNQTERWQALGMLNHILSCAYLPWELKKQAINFLLCVMEGNVEKCHDERTDASGFVPCLYASLQAVRMVLMYAPDAVLRKDAFHAFKRVLADVPACLRFETLLALVKNNECSSMIALLLDLVREELRMEYRQRISSGNEVRQSESSLCHEPYFWRAEVLEFVELVLRPTKGGPPSLPEDTDAVLSALTLYKFSLMTESA